MWRDGDRDHARPRHFRARCASRTRVRSMSDAATPSVTLYVAQRGGGGDDWPAYEAIESESIRALALLAQIPHAIESCASARASPSGALPCAEIDGDVDGAEVGGRAPRSAREGGARAREALRTRGRDADASADERAVIVAVNALCERNLRAASDYFTHVDGRGYEAYRREIGKTTPFPLSAWRASANAAETRRELERAGVDGERACALAVEAYSALNNMVVNSATRARDSEAYWLCGRKPRSCDATAFAQLSYHARSPSCDALRTEMKRFPRLVQYINDVSERFSELEKTLVRDASDESRAPYVDSTSWGDRYDAEHAERRKGWKPRASANKKLSEKDKEMRRKAWYSVAFAAASVMAYAFASGFISFDFGDDGDDEEESSEEDVDDEDDGIVDEDDEE